METAALVFLLVGGFISALGWLIGLVLLWSSSVWTTRDKVIGTLVVPGGLAGSVFLFSLWAVTTTSGGSNVLPLVMIGLLVAAPLITTAYLALELRRRGELATA